MYTSKIQKLVDKYNVEEVEFTSIIKGFEINKKLSEGWVILLLFNSLANTIVILGKQRRPKCSGIELFNGEHKPAIMFWDNELGLYKCSACGRVILREDPQ